MKNWPRVLLDIDGVVANFTQDVVDLINRWQGSVLTHDDCVRYEILKHYAGSESVRAVVESEIRAPFFCRTIDPYADAIEAVAEIAALAEVYVVTAPYSDAPYWVGERTAWVRAHLGIPKNRVIHTEAKHVCQGDVLIEDKPSNLDAWVVEHPDGLGILIDRPWNREDKTHFRANSWGEVLTAIRTYLHYKNAYQSRITR